MIKARTKTSALTLDPKAIKVALQPLEEGRYERHLLPSILLGDGSHWNVFDQFSGQTIQTWMGAKPRWFI